MQDFLGKRAVISGGGSGIGRSLAIQLVSEGCHIAICDVSNQSMAETEDLCRQANGAVTISSHQCDVSDEEAVNNFRDQVLEAHGTDYINLVFANAGIGGSGSFINDEREDWERTFGVCWYGVYYTARAFMPLLVASKEGHLINTSSINGFWASLGPGFPHTAYSAAKFAVKGFSEALVTDLRLNAPHVKVSVVMPGHIGTNIAINSGKVLGKPDPMDMPAEEVAKLRALMIKRGLPVDNIPDDAIRALIKQRGEDFRDNAPTKPKQAAEIILDGVRQDRWRILVGEDAHAIDAQVRAMPEEAYETSFLDQLHADGHLGIAASR